MMYYTTTDRGFSLVEVLVALTILLLVMAGPLRTLTQTTNTTAYANEQVAAFFLAQEGLELVQMTRDNLVLADFKGQFADDPAGATQPWTTLKGSTLDECFEATGCGLVAPAEGVGYSIRSCSDVTDCRLYLTPPVSGRAVYTHSNAGGAVETPYTRVITATTIPSSNPNKPRGVEVRSTVTWRTGSLVAGQEVVLVTHLYNVYATE